MLILGQHLIVQVVEDGVVLGTQLGKIRFRRDVTIQIHTVHQRVEVLHCILLAVRHDLAEELLQKLQMRGIAAARPALAHLVIVERGDDMERVEASVLRVAHVDDLTVQIVGKLRIFVFGVEDKDFRVLGGKIRQQGFGRVRLTGTGFAHDHHVGVDALRAAAKIQGKQAATVLLEMPRPSFAMGSSALTCEPMNACTWSNSILFRR